MRIGEFERASGLSRTTVRYYEQRGLLKPKGRTAGNSYRFYGEEHVERVGLIRMAQALGFSINEIAKLLRAWESKKLTSDHQKKVLIEKQGEIRGKIKNLEKMESYIKAKLDWLEKGEVGLPPKIGK
jgi:MerR family transcriptional regulator, copper efflux regulator